MKPEAWGARVVHRHGVGDCGDPRTSQLVPDEPERFVRDMEAAGFVLRVDDPEFVRRTRVMPFAHRATAMPLDVVLAGSGLEEESSFESIQKRAARET